MAVSIRDAKDALAGLRAAVEQLETALDARSKLKDLGKEADRIGNRLREEMGEQFDSVKWNRLCNELPEERQIASIHDAVEAAKARILEVRKHLHRSLDVLRSRKTAQTFVALDSVPLDVRDESIDRYIGLAESILASGTSPQSKKGGGRNEELARLKRQVRRIFVEFERPAYKDFCNRLDASGVSLPNSATWRKYKKWVDAFENANGAVSRWLSEAVNSEK